MESFITSRCNTHMWHHPSDEEIAQLEAQGCISTSWNQLWLHDYTDVAYIKRTTFMGHVAVGATREYVASPGGLMKHSGVNDVTLCDTFIGDDCLVEHVNGCISHYVIERGVSICNVDEMSVQGTSTFGQGVSLCVLSESGGRELIMHDALTSTEAYIQTLHTYIPGLTAQLHRMALQRAGEVRSSYGCIGAGAKIFHAGRITNVMVGAHAYIDGADELEEGTIVSFPSAPVYVGRGVKARQFIFQTDSRITDDARLLRVYVGQASEVGGAMSATDVFMGCNCQAFNGEMCSVLAGPYTVTHHKNTLLIGGAFSFLNAGSGTNQSNHMYKLGPSHYGILERGCKTGSSSHILWPAHFGVFTTVMGRFKAQGHFAHLPFSYAVEDGLHGRIIPAVGIMKIGTLRDLLKWPDRDARSEEVMRLDRVCYDVFSPFIYQEIEQGVKELEQLLLVEDGRGEGDVSYGQAHISMRHVRQGLHLYKGALDVIHALALVRLLKQLEEQYEVDAESIYDTLNRHVPDVTWVDAGGLMVSSQSLWQVEQEVCEGKINHVSLLNDKWVSLSDDYSHAKLDYMRLHVSRFLMEENGLACSSLIADGIIPLLERALTFVNTWRASVLADAQADLTLGEHAVFNVDAMPGWGNDLTQVRGTVNDLSVVRTIDNLSSGVIAPIEEWLTKLTIQQ